MNAATFLALHDTLHVHLGLYLLPLRHPMTVARQLSTLWEYAGSRLVFGVGVDDRREVELCGVDPRTRRRRMHECLAVLRALLSGRPVDFSGEFFHLEGGPRAAGSRLAHSDPGGRPIRGRDPPSCSSP